ncbi:MAG: hypothetical protein ABI850_06455 [Flavobacterium sp.]
MKQIIWIILMGTFISCSSLKIEKEVINDFLNKELKTDKSTTILVKEALPKIQALQYYENAYKERNLHEGKIRFAPNGYPPYVWEIDSMEISILKKEITIDTITYHWKKSDFKGQNLKIIPYSTIMKRGSHELGHNGIYLSKPLITTDKKHALLFYKSFAVEIGFSNEKAVLLKKVNGKWIELYHYNNVMQIN